MIIGIVALLISLLFCAIGWGLERAFRKEVAGWLRESVEKREELSIRLKLRDEELAVYREENNGLRAGLNAVLDGAKVDG